MNSKKMIALGHELKRGKQEAYLLPAIPNYRDLVALQEQLFKCKCDKCREKTWHLENFHGGSCLKCRDRYNEYDGYGYSEKYKEEVK